MGEVGVSGEEGMELEVLQEAYSENGKDDGAMVRWERFLPRMALRVLLVEADDSTRQIIAALLKKCSYKVAAVSDGLKAWEVLKRRPHSIDLILTEVELPSISGFALLTLTMEHEICKNIPVIMMSSHDSISTVYNCMLRGAADFLVKPIRRNELRNLWQHVWRRQSSTIGKSDPQDESVAQRKVGATAENNGASNHSSGYKACSPINKECIVMGSNSQSSCTKPEMEAESTYVENMQDFSHPKWSRSGQELLIQENEASGPAVASIKQGNRVFWEKDVEQERDMEDPNVTGKACGNNDSLFRSCKEAIDLIGAFDSNPQFSCRMSGSDVVQNKFDTFPQLDLSLRRSDPCGSENQITDEKQTLNHSNASAFSRYINRGSLPLRPEPSSICSQEKENGINSEKNLHTHVSTYNSDASCLTLNAQRSVSSMPTGHFRQAEATISCSQERVVPINVPVRGINFDSFSAGFGTVQPPVQSGPSPIQSETSDSKRIFESIPNANNLDSQSRYKENDKLESSDDRGHFSTTTDQSGSGRFCNGTANHLNSIGSGSICGSNGTSSNPVAGVRTGSEGANEEGLSTFDGNSHRSTQREAALNKFRLKRKDRCFEKKVRYESRKKLAEQRPRVKGQFVRQAQVDPLTAGG